MFHKLEVRLTGTNRKNVDLRFRKGYVASAAAAGRPSLNDILLDPLDATAIGLTASALPDPAMPGQYKIHTVVDLHDLALAQENGHVTGAIDLAFFLTGAKSARTLSRRIDIPADRVAAEMANGLVVDDVIAGEPATPGLRIVAQDHLSGKAGSVTIPLRK